MKIMSVNHEKIPFHLRQPSLSRFRKRPFSLKNHHFPQMCSCLVLVWAHHHHHHLSRSCHCWQMASTTCAMHFDPGPFSSIDCQRLPRCHLSISFWVFLLVVFHLWVSTLMLFSPTWCSSFWLHVLPTVLSCTSLVWYGHRPP